MPIYEYRCTGCRRKFEQIVLRGKALDEACCPSCGSQAVERLLSSFSLSGVRRKSEEDFDDNFASADADFEDAYSDDDIGGEGDLGYGEGDELEDQSLDGSVDDDLEEEELT